MRRNLIIIAGPTAVGKTRLAIDVARHFGAEIISADSRQFYKEMHIGTAKPTPAEVAEAKHHFVDFLSVDQEFNAYDFERAALRLLGDLFKENEWAVMSGGSGLYIKAVCEGIDYMPDIPAEVRARIKAELEKSGLEAGLKRLKEVDPAYYAEVDKSNPARILRGLEVFETSGKPFSSFRKGEKARRDFHIIKVGLERERAELYRRIDGRVDEMIELGLFDEAQRLFHLRRLNALNTVGYKEIFGYLEGAYGKEEATRLLKRNSRRYAKRQLTWFKKDKDYAWFHPGEFERIIEYIKKEGAGAGSFSRN